MASVRFRAIHSSALAKIRASQPFFITRFDISCRIRFAALVSRLDSSYITQQPRATFGPPAVISDRRRMARRRIRVAVLWGPPCCGLGLRECARAKHVEWFLAAEGLAERARSAARGFFAPPTPRLRSSGSLARMAFWRRGLGGDGRDRRGSGARGRVDVAYVHIKMLTLLAMYIYHYAAIIIF